VFEIFFKNKGKKPLWINSACMSPESTINIKLHNSSGTEVNRREKSEPYINWCEIAPGDKLHNVFDIASFWKAKEGNNYSFKFMGPVYTLKDPYNFSDDSKVKLESVTYESKLYEV
jgi:hypothetical protein